MEAVPRKFGKTRGSHLADWFLEGPASYLPLPTFILCLSPALAGGKAAEAKCKRSSKVMSESRGDVLVPWCGGDGVLNCHSVQGRKGGAGVGRE